MMTRQCMRLKFIHHLQLMFDIPQEHIRLREELRNVRFEESHFREKNQRLKCATFEKSWAPVDMLELKHLHDKLDLANAPAPKLDVAMRLQASLTQPPAEL